MTDGDCIITGGAGFIGCALSRQLSDRYRRVIIIDNLHSQVHPEQRRPESLDASAEFHHADVTLRETWIDVLAEAHPRAIVHLAAETGTAQSLTEASRHGEVNVIGTTRMLDALAITGRLPEQILLASSRAVYGEGIWQAADGTAMYPGQRSRSQLERGEWDFPGLTPVPFEATTTVPHPTSIYGATKLAQEHIITAWAMSFGIEPVIFRLQNVVGAGQSLVNAYTGIVTLFCRMARKGEAIPIYEDGQITRDFVHVEDVVEAMVAALTRPRTSIPPLSVPGAPNSVTSIPHRDLISAPLDVGSGRTYSIAQVASWIATYYGAPEPVVNGAYRLGDVRHASCDISRTMAALHWQPRRTLEDGLLQVCEWIGATFV